MRALFDKGMRDGIVQPLPPSTFAPDKVEEAFRFMSTGKHMGKVSVVHIKIIIKYTSLCR